MTILTENYHSQLNNGKLIQYKASQILVRPRRGVLLYVVRCLGLGGDFLDVLVWKIKPMEPTNWLLNWFFELIEFLQKLVICTYQH